MLMISSTAISDTLDISICMDPLLHKDSFEQPYDCSESETADVTIQDLRAGFGDPDPIGFCMNPITQPLFTACTDACDVDLQTGCYGTYTAIQLYLNPSDNKICGNYKIEIEDIDVVALSVLSCNLALLGTGFAVSELEATYTGPLTYEIAATTGTQVSGIDLNFTGCGNLGSVLETLTGFLHGEIGRIVAEQLDIAIASINGLGICPVDSLHPDFIPGSP